MWYSIYSQKCDTWKLDFKIYTSQPAYKGDNPPWTQDTCNYNIFTLKLEYFLIYPHLKGSLFLFLSCRYFHKTSYE